MAISSNAINLPKVQAELAAVAEHYEAALVGNQREILDGMFWSGPETLRYGLADQQYGFAAVAAFRAGLVQQSPPRRVLRCEVATYGEDFGTVNLEFAYTAQAGGGRQSQTWIRSDLPGHGGWRIVAAHVSLFAEKT